MDVFLLRFSIRFSYIMPKALIIQSGNRMVVSPYLLSGNDIQPTFAIKNADRNSFYHAYEKYLQNLIHCSCSFEELIDGSKNELLHNRYGILQIVSGRNNIFTDNFELSNGAKSWSSLFEQSSDIVIVGISMYGFFTPDGLEQKLVRLAAKGTNIKIIWADPYSDEVLLQSNAEHKSGKLKDHICLLHDIFESHINNLSGAEKASCREHLRLLYSETLPKGWIVKADNLMFYTPYFLSGPYEEPVYIISKGNNDNQFMFNRLINYIDELSKTCKEYIDLSHYDPDHLFGTPHQFATSK